MNAKLNFLSKHEENRPFCAPQRVAMTLLVMLLTATTAWADYTVTMETLTYEMDGTTVDTSGEGGTAVIRIELPQGNCSTYTSSSWDLIVYYNPVARAVAIPARGYKFVEWQISEYKGTPDDNVLGNTRDSETSINQISGDLKLTAVFQALPQFDLPEDLDDLDVDDHGNVTLSMEGIYKISGHVTITGNLIIDNHAIIDFDGNDGVMSSSLTVNGEVSISGSNLLEFFSSRVLVYSNFSSSPKQVATILDNPQYNSQGNIDALSGKTFAGFNGLLVSTTEDAINLSTIDADDNWTKTKTSADFCIGTASPYTFYYLYNGYDGVGLQYMNSLAEGSSLVYSVTNTTTGDAVPLDPNNDPNADGRKATFTMPADDDVNVSVTTFPEKAYVTGLDYIGFEGKAYNTGTEMKVYVLDGSETVLGSDGKTTWYVSNTPKSSAKPNGITFTNDVTLAGDVCIILADGSAMTVQGSISGAGKSLYLYGQEGSTGSLDFWSIACNDVTITGGIISSENTNGNVIVCSNNISITGGQVTIPSSNSGYGSLVASSGRIYLGWTLPTDCYNIGIYDASLIALQENKRFVAYDAATGTAATAVLSNSVSKDSEERYSSINGKWLRPVNGNIVTPGADISVGTLSGTTFTATDPDFTITTDASTESEVTTPYYIYSADSKVNMKYTGEFGENDKSVTYTLTGATLDDYDYFGGTNGAHQNADGRLTSFTMPANDVTASASLNPFTQPGGYCGKSNVNNGKNLVWTVTDVGTGSNQVRTLTISKNPDDSAISGQTNFNMADYRNDNSDNFAPWIKPNAAGNGSDGLKYPITTVSIADGVTSIGSEAFEGCRSLQNVTIGSSVTSIGNQAFDHCSGLQNVTIGNDVTTIGGYAFRGCEELQEVSIGSSVTTIGDHAFDGCKILQEVTIPASVTTIESNAFYDCFGLTVVTMLRNDPPSLGNIYVFENCLLKLILVPNETAYAAYNAAGGGWDGKYSADINLEPEDITYKSLLAPSEISLAKNASGWGTYCHRYPISYSLSDGATAYTLSGLNNDKTAVTIQETAVTIQETDVNAVAPLTPLLLNYTAPDNDAETDDETVTLTALPATATRVSNDVIVNNGNTGCTFYGNATGTTQTHDPDSDPDDGIPALIGGWSTYILRNGTFVLVDTDEGIPAHRCVLSIGSSNAARVLTIGIDDETTGITTTNYTNFTNSDKWYAIDGRKLDKQPTKKGLYINNGKKTVIK